MSTCTKCSKLEDICDLHRDEFKRIIALGASGAPPWAWVRVGEIDGICKRAISVIEQTAPVVVQRDNLQSENARFRMLLEGCYHALRSYQHGNSHTDLAEEMANKVHSTLFGESKKVTNSPKTASV